MSRVTITKSALALALAALVGCAGPTSEKKTSAFASLDFERNPSVPAVLALMPDSLSTRQTYDGLAEELGREFDLVPSFVTKATSPSDIARVIAKTDPKAIVLMNNPTLRLYSRYQRTARVEAQRIPVVGVMTSFLRESSAGTKNLTGIIYEVPLVTSLVNLRSLLEQPVRRVGVPYRPSFKAFIDEQQRLASSEGFELVGVPVSGDDALEVRDALRRLRGELDVDAIWVLNDNVLLSRRMLRRGWLPGLRQNRTPVLVNVRSLVSSAVEFGTFGVLPDHRALGTQAGQLLVSLAERNWRADTDNAFEYPLSVEKVLDIRFARRNLKLQEGQLATVDQLVE